MTRPLPEAERTAASLVRRGHSALIAPMLLINAVDADLDPARYHGVIMTSGNAARALSAHRNRDALLALPVFAVGRQTARAAQDAGFASVRSADGDAGDLVRLVNSQDLSGPLLYLAGSDRARDLPGELAAGGIEADPVVIYRAEAAEGLPEPARDALKEGRIGAVLHFSRRTAATFLDCAETAGLICAAGRVAHYCLSPRVAEPLLAAGIKAVQIAPRPDEDALLNLLPSI
ncbi:MAG TPA: uroporphyrinogen-III synthase [Pseudorhodoplanes sp.]|nr:uroporphyrinogen-III synthase [Pseudorhodoplanes sp.]